MKFVLFLYLTHSYFKGGTKLDKTYKYTSVLERYQKNEEYSRPFLQIPLYELILYEKIEKEDKKTPEVIIIDLVNDECLIEL